MSLADGVSFIASSSGNGTFVSGMSRPSFLTLAQAVTNGELVDGQTVSYLAQDSLSDPTQREWGYGTFTAVSNSITRTTVLGTVSSNTAGSSSPLNFSVPPTVSLTALAEDISPTVSSMAALRAYPGVSPPNNTIVYLQGYNLPGDGGQGFFRWIGSSQLGDDGGTVIDPTWNTSPSGGPNLVTNGTFASGQTGWTITAGSPTFTGNMVTDPNADEFWQVTQVISGLAPGETYIASVDYTLVQGGDPEAFVSVSLAGARFNDTPAAAPTTWSINFTVTATSQTLVLAGRGSPSAMTNVSVSLAPGGRWLRQIDEQGRAIQNGGGQA